MISTIKVPLTHPEDIAEVRDNARKLRPRMQDDYFKRRLASPKSMLVGRVVAPGDAIIKSVIARWRRAVVHDLTVVTGPLTFEPDERIQLHRDGHCYCFDCVETRNCPKPKAVFHDEMLLRGFTDGTWDMRESIGSDFYDDIVFLLNRIHSLSNSKIRTEHTPIAQTSPEQFLFDRAVQQRRAELFPTSRPLERIGITKDPDHWFSSYWANSGDVIKDYTRRTESWSTLWSTPKGYHWENEQYVTRRVLPTDQNFHQYYLDVLEQVELNHDLPSGGTRTYVFESKATPPKAPWTNPIFNGLPYSIDDSVVSFEEQLTPPTPDPWPQHHIQVEYTLLGAVVTNVRCTVCGAVNKQQYPKLSALGSFKLEMCTVENSLCDRDACTRSREVAGNFDARRLVVGYQHFSYFQPLIDKSLWSWTASNKRFDGDQNLKCNLRYALDRRGRRGITSDTSEYEKDVAQPAGVFTADDQYFEWDFITQIRKDVSAIPSPLTVYEWRFDPSVHKIGKFYLPVHKIVGGTFEETRHLPSYVAFGPSDDEVSKTSKLYQIIKAYIIKGPSVIYISEYRDPEVTKLDEVTWREKLKASFESTGLHWYSNPDTLGGTIFSTTKNTFGAADQILQDQIRKLEDLRRRGPVEKFIEDIYLGGKSLKAVADESGTSKAAVKQKVYRDLNKPVIGEDAMWAGLTGTYEDGIYALAILGGRTRAYLILPATQFAEILEGDAALIEDGLHNVICDLLERRIRNGRGLPWCLTTDGCREEYREVYDEFNRFGWRMLRAGKWYQEDQTEVPAFATT